MHDEYGKRLLSRATNGAVEQYGRAVEIDHGMGGFCRIDGALNDEVAIEVESRTSKQVRGAILDLLCHAYPKKLLVLLPVHMNSQSTRRQAEAILRKFSSTGSFGVVVTEGHGAEPREEDDIEVIREALAELGVPTPDRRTEMTDSVAKHGPDTSQAPERPSGKYAPLQEHLAQVPGSKQEVMFTFDQLAVILGFVLPKSAFNYREWWANQVDTSTRPQARAWINAGFRVETVRLHGNESWVQFVRDRL